MGILVRPKRFRRIKLPTPVSDELIQSLTEEEAWELERKIRYDWPLWARPLQLAPPDSTWDILVLNAGRGGGKTRPGAETTNRKAFLGGKGYRIGLIGRTAADVRDTMVLGESGVLACSPPWFRPRYFPALKLIRWPNGAEGHTYTADEPDSTRGPQHHFLWGDEYGAWKKAVTMSNALDGLRLGPHPQALLTSMPRRTALVRDTVLGPLDRRTGRRPVSAERRKGSEWGYTLILKDQWGREIRHKTLVRRWRTEDNSVNLSPGFAVKRRMMYGESSLGRQEMDGEIQEAVEGALWSQDTLDDNAVLAPPKLRRIEVAIDPTRSDDPVDECGIVVAGLGEDGICYILEDCTVTGPPEEWATAAVSAYNRYSAAAAVYEANRIGQQVKRTIRTVGKKVNWVPVTATEDKWLRASPVSSLASQGRVKHVRSPRHDEDELLENPLALLEDELVTWDPASKKSPNRLDAYVWVVTSLMIGLPHTPAVHPGAIMR